MAFWKSREGERILKDDKNTGPAARPAPIATTTSAGGSEVGSAVLQGGGGPSSGAARPAAPSGVTPEPRAPSEAVADRYGKLRSALGPGTVIQGKLSFDTPVRIDGRLSGEVFSSQAIIVGETGSVDATLEAASLVVFGTVKGRVKVTDRIELYRGGRIEADFNAPVFVVEEGGFFTGRCSMALGSPAGVASRPEPTKGGEKVLERSVERVQPEQPTGSSSRGNQQGAPSGKAASV